MQKEPIKGYSGRVKVPRPTPPGERRARGQFRGGTFDEDAMQAAYAAYDSAFVDSPMQGFLEDNDDGDGLAVFIARELAYVTTADDDAESALAGVRAMEEAMADLTRVRDALAKLWIERKGP